MRKLHSHTYICMHLHIYVHVNLDKMCSDKNSTSARLHRESCWWQRAGVIDYHSVQCSLVIDTHPCLQLTYYIRGPQIFSEQGPRLE